MARRRQKPTGYGRLRLWLNLALPDTGRRPSAMESSAGTNKQCTLYRLSFSHSSGAASRTFSFKTSLRLAIQPLFGFGTCKYFSPFPPRRCICQMNARGCIISRLLVFEQNLDARC